jgi:hypothetical protein
MLLGTWSYKVEKDLTQVSRLGKVCTREKEINTIFVFILLD